MKSLSAEKPTLKGNGTKSGRGVISRSISTSSHVTACTDPSAKDGLDFDDRSVAEVHVIHLPRAKARKKFFLTMNRSPDVRWIFEEGVDSRTLDFQKLKAENLVQAGTRFRTPGCSLAHRKLWLKAAKAAAPFIICEDDVVFRKDFPLQLKSCLGRLPEGWDIFFLGYNFDGTLDVDIIGGIEYFKGRFFNQQQKRLEAAELKQFSNMTLPVGVLPLINVFGTPAYVLSPKGAEFLLKHVFPLRNCRVTFRASGRVVAAHTMDTIMNKYYCEMKAYVSLPPLAVTPNIKDPEAQIVMIH